MEATSVKINQETLDSGKLTKAKKTKLRRKLIMEFIESKPAGTPITYHDIKDLARFSTYANAHAFVKRMVRDKLVRVLPLPDKVKGQSFETTRSVKTTTPPIHHKSLVLATMPKTMTHLLKWNHLQKLSHGKITAIA